MHKAMKTMMKTTCMAVLLLLAASIQAQNPVFGIRAGMNLSTVSAAGNLYDNSQVQPGFTAALMARYSLAKNWEVMSELSFEQKGISTSLGSGDWETVNTRQFDYLTVPLAIRGSMPLAGKVRLFGQAGTYGSILLNSGTSQKINGEQAIHQNSDPNIKSNDFGWIAGCGVDIPLKNHSLSAEIRFERGIMEVDKNDTELRNKAFSIQLGYWF